MTGANLIRTASIQERCLARNAALDAFDQMETLAKRANEHWAKACGEAGLDDLRRHCRPSIEANPCRYSGRQHAHDARENLRRKIDRDAWRAVFRFSGMAKLMSAKQVQVFETGLEENPPAFELETIQATFAVYMENPASVFRQSVRDAFDALPNNFKSNDRFKLGKKLVMCYALNWWGGYPTWHHRPSHRHTSRRDELADLHRMLRMLDDKPDVTCITETAAVAMRDDTAAGRFADDYLEVRWYRNGNLHVAFQRPDLVKRLNKILAEQAGDVIPSAA